MKNLLSVAMAALSISLLSSTAMAGSVPASPPVRNFLSEMPTQDVKFLPKWARVVESGELETGIDLFLPTPKFSDLENVQKAANKFKYKSDQENYGIKDYWASPRETQINYGGDCEDIAIWKYGMLKRAAWKKQDLTMWIVKVKETGMQHAILIAKIDNKDWLLNSPAFDGDASSVMPIEATSEYMNATFEFMYRFNEIGWSTK